VNRWSFQFVLATWALWLAWLPSGGHAQAPSTSDARAAERLQALAESLAIESDGEKLPLRSTPVLRYSDPARGYVAAGVWRTGKEGRPKALVTLQYSPTALEGKPRIDYELLSLAHAPVSLKSRQAVVQSDDAVAFKSLPGAEAPAQSPTQRLLQLRRLARRFAATENLVGDVAELRLLPQPIDRYMDPKQEIVDGALFVFAYGVNPEAVLFLECDEKGWRYAVGRLAWAALEVDLDGKEVARFDQILSTPESGAYRTAGHGEAADTENEAR
jgi:hypothetical protein